MLLLRDGTIRAAMESADVVGGLEGMLSRPVDGSLELPARLTVDAAGGQGFLRLMPVIAYDTGYVGYKAMNYHPVHGVRYLISLISLEDGELLALLDADWITAYRTAATAAIAVKHLAPPDAGTLTVIGSGTQARALLRASSEVHRPRRVLVYSPTPANRKLFAEEMSAELGLSVEPVEDLPAALKSADVILSAHRAGATPLIYPDVVKKGALVCAISSVRPAHREVDASLWGCSRVVVDDLGHVLESGDGRAADALGLAGADKVAELWQVLRDPSRGRRSAEDRVLYKSVGTAEQDIALAAMVYARARSLGMGEELAEFPSRRPIQSRVLATADETRRN